MLLYQNASFKFSRFLFSFPYSSYFKIITQCIYRFRTHTIQTHRFLKRLAIVLRTGVYFTHYIHQEFREKYRGGVNHEEGRKQYSAEENQDDQRNSELLSLGSGTQSITNGTARIADNGEALRWGIQGTTGAAAAEVAADPRCRLLYAYDDIYAKALPYPELAIQTLYEGMHLAAGKTIKYARFTISK